MWQWAQQTLANVAGTQEPIYGPNAIQSVEKQAQETPYTELTKDDLKWRLLPYTNVETQTFYVHTDDGKICMAQIIYSNVMNVNVTVQFCSKIFYPNATTSTGERKPPLFTSDPLSNHTTTPDGHSFHADAVSFDLSADGAAYTIKSSINPACVVDVTFTRAAPGWKAGRDGTSTFGTDATNPWGHMYHAFWPSCRVRGVFRTAEGDVDVSGRGVFSHAVQGMKPHHAAARWNFASFRGARHDALMMEYTTPASYGATVVNVGGVVAVHNGDGDGDGGKETDGELLFAGAPMHAEHTESQRDEENEWPAPTAARYAWRGRTRDGRDVAAELAGALGERLDRIDVMAEVPKFVKQIIAGAAGTKPYVYQYGPKMKLKIKIGDGPEEEDEGVLFTEATFIS